MKILTILQAVALAALAITGAYAAQSQPQAVKPACVQTETTTDACDL